MSEPEVMFRRYRSHMLVLFGILAIGWVLSADKAIFNGLFLGGIASLFNLWSLFRFSRKLPSAVKEGKGFFATGMVSRIASVSIAILISLFNPEYFHLIATIIGLLSSYIVILIDSAITIFKK